MKKWIYFIPFLVVVACNEAPVCNIVDPIDGQNIKKDINLEIAIEAYDDDGSISEVVINVNGDFVKNFSSPPYSFTINTEQLEVGSVILDAIAYDDKGSIGMDTIQIAIGNTPIINTVEPDSIDMNIALLSVKVLSQGTGDIVNYGVYLSNDDNPIENGTKIFFDHEKSTPV